MKIEVLRIEETPTWKGKLCRKGGIVSSRYPPPLTFATNTSALLTRNTLTLFTTNTLTCTRTIMSTWGWDRVERLVTTELEGIVTVHCDENQSPEILRDQMISVVATIIWVVFKLQAAIARRSADKVVVAVPLTQIGKIFF